MYRSLDELPYMLTVPQVADFLQIGKNAAYELVRSYNLPCVKLGERTTRVLRSVILYVFKSHIHICVFKLQLQNCLNLYIIIVPVVTGRR